MEAVIFDFDGVIADSFELTYETFHEILRRYHLQGMLTRDRLRRFLKRDHTSLLYHLKLKKEAIGTFEKRFQDHFMAHITKVPMFPGMKKVIQECRKTKKLGIVSTNKEIIIEKFLKHHKVRSSFHSIADQSKGIKPKPEPLLYCLSQLHIQPNHAVFIGDRPVDRETACLAGTRFIGVQCGYPGNMWESEVMVQSPEDILEAVK